MATLYDVAHFCSWNGYAEDMRGYFESGKEAWTNTEFWFPYGVNMRYGKKKKTRMQVICEKMSAAHDPKNIYRSQMLSSYNPLARVKALLALGGNPNLADTTGYTPLHICARNGWAGHISIIKALLDGGADVNMRDEYGYSPLFLAANNGHTEIVKLLLQRGANVNLFANNGTLPLYAAVSGCYLPITKILLAHGATIPHDIVKDAIQCDGNGTPILRFLYSVDCPKIPLSIQCAVYNDKPLLIRTLIKLGEDPNVGDTFSPIQCAILLNNECVTELCRGGVDLENGINHASALHYAISFRKLEAAVILCRYGANTRALSEDGKSVLDVMITHARFRGPTDMDGFRAILKYIKDFTVVNDEGDTPLNSAVKWGLNDMAYEIKRAMLRQKGT